MTKTIVKPDVIVCNPYSIDYPYWRSEMEKNRHKFNKILVGCYQDSRKYNFMDFLKEACPWAEIIDTKYDASLDWRNQSLQPCLERSNSDWVLFLEQDFVPLESNFWDKVLKECQDYDIVGTTEIDRSTSFQGEMGDKWQIGVRLHPFFILVRRSILEKTSKDFGAHPENNRDHFATFTDEVYSLHNIRYLDLKKYKFKHYSGVYTNYMSVQRGEGIYYPFPDFKDFVRLNIEAPVKQDPRFLEWSYECLMA